MSGPTAARLAIGFCPGVVAGVVICRGSAVMPMFARLFGRMRYSVFPLAGTLAGAAHARGAANNNTKPGARNANRKGEAPFTDIAYDPNAT